MNSSSFRLTSRSVATSDSHKISLRTVKSRSCYASVVVLNEATVGATEIVGGSRQVLPHVYLAVRIGDPVDDLPSACSGHDQAVLFEEGLKEGRIEHESRDRRQSEL